MSETEERLKFIAEMLLGSELFCDDKQTALRQLLVIFKTAHVDIRKPIVDLEYFIKTAKSYKQLYDQLKLQTDLWEKEEETIKPAEGL